MIKEIGAFLALAVGPLAKRVLAALGIGWLTYECLSVLAAQAQAAVLANWGAMPVSVLQVLTLAGFADAVGITLGAFSARLALATMARLGKIGT